MSPLPLGERIKVRGKPSESLSTLTPTLSRQRERGLYLPFSWFVGEEAGMGNCRNNVTARNNVLRLLDSPYLQGSRKNAMRV